MNLIEICADLHIESENSAWTLTAAGKSGVLKCSKAPGPFWLFNNALTLLSMREKIRSIHRLLNAQHLHFDVELGGRTVMRAGNLAKPGIASQILRFHPAELVSWNLISAMVSRGSLRSGRP